MKISFIIPSRNNLKYLKWCYDSIRKNQGNHEVEICVADDASTDGTWSWCQEIMMKDSDFKAIRNEGPNRLGLVILNDRLIDEVASHDICMVFHADMYLCPEALDHIEKNIKPKTIVSLTRIEPPLHPEGPEKIVEDFGVEPETFKEDELLRWLIGFNQGEEIPDTEGIFAPWAFYKSEFQEIGGHDPLFAPQSKEDSDIFNRFQLNGTKFIQTWKGFVYHMTSRGSRFNPYSGGAPGKNSDEWIGTTTANMKKFIKKWGTAVQHDQFMKPIVSPVYKKSIKINNSTPQLEEVLEPWSNGGDDIIIKIDGNRFNNEDFKYLQNLNEIIKDSGELGEFELGNLHITINSLETYEKDLIICKKQ
jgi:glycosyltransferase involved in cell wall biosynthesis